MVSLTQLLLPILLSAVFVFIASTLIHTVLKWHNSDYKKLSNEDEVRAAIRKGSPAPAQYIIPHCKHGPDMKDPAMVRRFEEGPSGVLFVRPSGMPKLGPFLGAWFAYTLAVGCIVAFLASTTLKVGADYKVVFHLVAISAWLGYAWQGPGDSIWRGKPWSCTVKEMVDGLIYALLTAGTFGWLWPR